MMSLFKKPKRNFRQRIVKFESDEEDGESTENKNKKLLEGNAAAAAVVPKGASSVGGEKLLSQPPLPPPTTKLQCDDIKPKKIKSTTPKSKPLSILSFQDEEDEEEVFKVKKSSQSRRLAKMLERERKLKSREKSKDGDGQSNENLNSDLVKDEKEETNAYYGEYAEIIPASDDEDDQDSPNSCSVQFRTILESGAIPDAAMIHAARKRRQMAREMGDFVRVDDTEQYQGNNSRLVRDDDNDRSDEDDDEEGRLSFTVNTAARDREKVREAIMSASQPRATESGGEEVDEELERWEQEQIRKGVSIPQIQVQQQDTLQSQHENHYYTQNYYTSSTVETTIPGVSSVVTGLSIPPGFSSADVSVTCQGIGTSIGEKFSQAPNAPPPDVLSREVPTLEMVRLRLQERFLSLNEVHRTHERDLERFVDLLEGSECRVLVQEKEVPALANQFTFYQEMRGYVTDLVECLDEKVIPINSFEMAMFNLLKQKSARLIGRRQQDVKDQAEEFTKLSCKLTTAALADTIGRDKNGAEDTARMRRIAEREGRRSRRRRARESKISDVKHYEGMSSDDEEMEADVTRFLAERDRIIRESAAVFEDVVEDFSSLASVKARFEEWKKRFPNSYNEAYIGLCLPKICAPLVRLQLIPWDPLKDGRSFEDMAWYETLMFFGFDECADLESLRCDSDVNLVPTVVERTILTRVTEAVENAWDPMSTSQTLRLVRLIKKLVDEYPSVTGGSKKLTALLQAVLARLKKTLDEDVYVPLFPKTLLENTSLGANAFFQRQFWSCVKLLHNILSWQGILSDAFLQQLALDSLLNRYVLLALQTWPGGFDADKAQMIASVLPRSWFSRLSGEKTLPQLEMFCRYLKNAAANLEKNANYLATTQGFPLTPKADPKDSLKDIIKILATIRAMDHALSLANQFSLKDLKSLVSSG